MSITTKENNQNIGNIDNSEVNGANVKQGIVTTKSPIINQKYGVWRSWDKSMKIILYINAGLLLLNIVLICIKFPSSNKLNFDYMGIIVALLSLIVMVLISWNIFSALEVKKDVTMLRDDFENVKEEVGITEKAFIKKTNEIENSFNDKISETIEIVEKTNENSGKRFLYNRASIETELAMSVYSEIDRFNYILGHLLSAIALWSELNEYKKASDCVGHIIETIPKDASVKSKNKKEWLKKLKQVPVQDKIDNIETLYVFLSNLKVEE